MKDVFLRNCTGCHEANIALQNRFDERGWEVIIDRDEPPQYGRRSSPAGSAAQSRPQLLQEGPCRLSRRDAGTLRAAHATRAASPLDRRGDAAGRVPVRRAVRVGPPATVRTTAAIGRKVRCPAAAAGSACTMRSADREGHLWLSDNTEASMSAHHREGGRRGPARSRNYKVPGAAAGQDTPTGSSWPATAWSGSR